MNEPTRNWKDDLEALRYVDALDAGDLDGIAALWDQASRDPVLEAQLVELDDALFDDQAKKNRKFDPEPIVAHSLAQADGFGGPSRRQRSPTWWRRAAAIGAAAAAGLLGLLAWSTHEHQKESPIVTSNERPQPLAPTIAQELNTRLALESQSWRTLNIDDVPPFRWPVHGNDSERGIRLDSGSFDRSDNPDPSF